MNSNKLKKLRNNPRKCVIANLKDFNKRKRSCLTIKSSKNSFLNSIIVGISLLYQGKKNPCFSLPAKLLECQCVKTLKRIRLKLKRDALVKTGSPVRFVKHWLAYLKSIGIDIIIFQGNLHFKIFGDVSEFNNTHQIYLIRYKNDNRDKSKKKFKYDVIKNPSGYFQKGFLCKKCFKFSKSKRIHCCRYACYMCKSLKRHDRDVSLYPSSKCDSCKRYFYGRSCKKLHNENKVCDRKKFCELCYSTYVVKPKREHYCRTENYCLTCKIVHEPNRHFIKGEIDKPEPTTNFLIFDFETFPDGEQKLETAYFCSTRLYTISYKTETVVNSDGSVSETLEVDDNYTFVEKNFEGLNCSKDFYKYVTSGEIPRKTVCIAHNGQSFDFYFVLKHFFTSEDHTPELILNGLKLMQMAFDGLGLKFVDSLNFMPFSLRKFPDLFGFSERKTFFPHNFVSKSRLDYVGDIPNIEEYGIKENEVKDFEKFYNEERDRLQSNNLKWCLMDVAREYCVQDVNVLFLGVFNYLKTFMKVTKGIDPFA
jgi:hypothetical protein